MVDFLPKVKLEVVVPDELVDQCIEAIIETAQTGKIGDGKILFITLREPSAFARAKKTRMRFSAK